MRPLFALVPLCLALMACNGNLQDGLYAGQAKAPPPPPPPPVVLETKYRPDSVVPSPAITRQAIEVGPGDVRRMPEEAVLLGKLALRVRVDATEGELARAIGGAVAARGGTHYVVSNDNTETRQDLERDERAERGRAVARAFGDMGCSMQGKNASPDCYRSHYDGPIYKTTTTSERYVYVVAITVPEDGWGKLPRALQPRAVASARPRRPSASPSATAAPATSAAVAGGDVRESDQ